MSRTKATSASTFTTRRSKPVEKAAAQAAARPGSEVAPSETKPVTVLAASRTATGSLGDLALPPAARPPVAELLRTWHDRAA